MVDNEALTPMGNPDAERLISWAAPLLYAAVIIVAAVLDGPNVIDPPFANEKSKRGVAKLEPAEPSPIMTANSAGRIVLM